MNLFGSSLAAVTASLFTWHSMHKQHQQQRQLNAEPMQAATPIPAATPWAVGLSDTRDGGACDCHEIRTPCELDTAPGSGARELGDGASANSEEETKAEAQDAPGVADPFLDLLDAAGRSSVIALDVAMYAADAVARQIWQWPGDAAPVLPGLEADARHAWQTFASDAEAFIPAQVVAQGKDGARLLWRGASGLLPFAGAALAPPLGAARRASAAWIEGFVKRYPQHQRALEEHDPLVVVSLLCLAPVIGVLEVMMLWPLVRWLVRMACLSLCAPCACCCRCGRGRTAVVKAKGGKLARAASVGSAPSRRSVASLGGA